MKYKFNLMVIFINRKIGSTNLIKNRGIAIMIFFFEIFV